MSSAFESLASRARRNSARTRSRKLRSLSSGVSAALLAETDGNTSLTAERWGTNPYCCEPRSHCDCDFVTGSRMRSGADVERPVRRMAR